MQDEPVDVLERDAAAVGGLAEHLRHCAGGELEDLLPRHRHGRVPGPRARRRASRKRLGLALPLDLHRRPQIVVPPAVAARRDTVRLARRAARDGAACGGTKPRGGREARADDPP